MSGLPAIFLLKSHNMSVRSNTIYSCTKCGAQSPKWLGRCSECGSWGTLSQQSTISNQQSAIKNDISAAQVLDFSEVEASDVKRVPTGISEFDRVLGGGIVPGSLTLIGGDPGIGKSTLLLQLVNQQSTINNQQFSLYVSAEESAQQVKLRLTRLGLKTDNLKFLPETNIDTICATIKKQNPSLAVIDSIQTVSTSDADSEPGSVTQVRASTSKLMETAKQNNISIFIVGHVTKEGAVAGPKTLEHLVDTVLYLEGDQYHDFRILRSVKNRFGSTNEVGIFEMTGQGLKQVKNPSEKFLSTSSKNAPGSIVTCIIEGTRPFLVEVQALVTKTAFGYPQRKASGFDLNRLQLLLAVLEKRFGYKFADQDVFINISGGLKIKEPAADLAICLALISALKNKAPQKGSVVFGEVSLTGQVRPVTQPDRRVNEAKTLGYENVVSDVRDINEAVQSVVGNPANSGRW